MFVFARVCVLMAYTHCCLVVNEIGSEKKKGVVVKRVEWAKISVTQYDSRLRQSPDFQVHDPAKEGISMFACYVCLVR